MKLTAIIPTYNEESNVQRALDSVMFADEIIVIDSFSTDATLSIAKQTKATIIQRKFDDFSSQKNYAIAKASHNWIFLLDADEQIPPQLKQEILKVIQQKDAKDAYFVYRYFFMKHHKIRFSGWQRDKVIRLFKKDNNTYKGLVHETIQTQGNVGFLKHRLNHFSYTSYMQYRSKLHLYAKLQAKELYLKGKTVNLFHFLFKPFIRFLIHFIIKLGFLDGLNGLKISFIHSYGVFLRYVELLKLQRNTKQAKRL